MKSRVFTNKISHASIQVKGHNPLHILFQLFTVGVGFFFLLRSDGSNVFPISPETIQNIVVFFFYFFCLFLDFCFAMVWVFCLFFRWVFFVKQDLPS